MEIKTGANTAIVPDSRGQVAVTVTWTADAEADLFAFLVEADGKVGQSGGLVHADQAGGTALPVVATAHGFVAALTALPATVDRVAVAIAPRQGRNIGSLGTIKVASGEHHYAPETAGRSERALILVELYRRQSAWKLRAVGQGFVAGLEPLGAHFGVRISARPEAKATPAAPGADEARARAERINAGLAARGIRVNRNLPPHPPLAAISLPSTEAVFARAVAIFAAAVRGDGAPPAAVLDRLEANGLSAALSPEERRFVTTEPLIEAEVARFRWRYECLPVLMWALNLADRPGPPDQPMRPDRDLVALNDLIDVRDRRHLRLRPAADIVEEAELALRLHWAAVDARVNGGAPPPGVDGGIVMERDRALRWLVLGGAWDAVPLDT